jgi:hypothetical protein
VHEIRPGKLVQPVVEAPGLLLVERDLAAAR